MTIKFNIDKVLNSEILKLISRLTLSLIFIFFAIEKISDPAFFSKEINNYQILPNIFVNISAIVLPWLELIAGFMLLFGVKLKASSAIIGSLLVIFILAVGFAMMKGLNINCGCSGANSQKVGWLKIFENLSLTVLSIYIFLFPNTKYILISSKNE